MKANLSRIEGLFKGFKQNLEQAFKLNSALDGELKDLENARKHETWMTIGHAFASIGLLVMAWFDGQYAHISIPLAIGSSMGAVFRLKASDHDKASINQIEEYEAELHQYI